MSAHELLRKGGWRMRTIGGEPHWEHPTQPDVNYSTACAMEQALAWAQREELEVHAKNRTHWEDQHNAMLELLDYEREAHAKTREELAAALEDNADAESHLAALHAEFDRHCAATECTPAERKVLEAMADIDLSPAKLDEDGLTASELESIVDAELARRGEKSNG